MLLSVLQVSIYAFMHRERDRLFPDEEFADLFDDQGRRSVPPSVVATVMVLQRLEGLSDREAVDRYCFDNRWRYATGVGSYDTGAWTRFAHTVLVDMRERLRRSERPDRIFEAALGPTFRAYTAELRRQASAAKPAPAPVIPAPQPPTSAPLTGIADELAKLAALRDSGVLSAGEFDAQKAKLLGTT